jgi:hypothetical protein
VLRIFVDVDTIANVEVVAVAVRLVDINDSAVVE